MINIVSPINQLGYGITSLNIVKSLSKITSVSLWPIGQPQVTNQEDANIISNAIKNGQFTKFDAPCIKIWHQNDMTQFVGFGKRIGFPIFELDKFNDLEKHHLNSLDKIFVCSEWAKTVIVNETILDDKNVHVIPLGVNTDIFKPSPYPNTKTTRFFNCGKWEIRKGHDILVELFNEAFETQDDVELILMCDNPFYSKEDQEKWEKLYLNSKLGDKIRIIPRQSTQEEVYSIMAQTHCGVFPSRAEGWNLELLEMMACGKHVITTEYAAHTEFCNSNNAHLTKISSHELANDGKWFYGQGNWAKIGPQEKASMIEHMRLIHNMHKNNALSINTHGIDTANTFTWNNSARKILTNVF
jgi:glycosyltransferase involved in cell wall biosynthesis